MDDRIYSKPEVLLGDLRGGICSSGLCRQLRAVAADEIERLNKWADGFSDAQLKERQTGELYQRELRAEVERLREENRRLLTGDRVVYFPCKEHMGLPFTMTVGFAPPTMCKCPICEPPPSPLSAGGEP